MLRMRKKVYSTKLLRQHFQSVHKGIKKHECNHCDYKTATGASLKKHIIAIHEQKQNYDCHLCEFKTAHKWYLKVHIGQLHEGKRIKCDECNKDFSRKDVLRKHRRAAH